VTGSNPPPNGGDRGAARPQAEPARAVPNAAKPAAVSPPNAQAVKPAAVSPANAQAAKLAAASPANPQAAKPAPSPTNLQALKPAVVPPPNPQTAKPAAAPPQQPRPAAATTPRSPASAAPPAQPAPAPPGSERQANGGAGAAATDSKPSDPKRFMPRSPRSALEPDTVSMPMRRSKSVRHPLVVIGNAIFSLLVLLAVVAGAGLFLGKQRFEMPGPLPQDKVVNIPHGSGIRDIADVLQREGVIDQPWVFVGGVLVLKAREDLKWGEYQFTAHASLRDVVQTIVDGRVVSHQISIPEGLTSEQIVARLLQDDILVGNIKEIPREGSLLPDTYNFTRGITREQVIQRMQTAQQRLVKDIWDRHSPDLPLKTPDQLVTLASIVEKETAKPDERTRVAAVFVNRLNKKMRLQSDPTIIYGLVGGKGTLGRAIMKSEVEQPTPYNTYQIDGLPPGPICNPGRASLEAAASPARTRELYFVADGTGGHVFAENYDQHQKNVARLHLIETDQRDRAPADLVAPAPPPAAAAVPAAVGTAAPAAASAPHRTTTTTTHHNPTTPSAAPAQPAQAAQPSR
jgi:UPF0755 protein